MNLMVNPVITDFRQDVNGDIKMLKLGANKEDAYANIIEQGASAKLDNNKTATINVSTYTEPVVITPTSGKDGMKKATITLSNIPSGSVTLHCWGHKGEDESIELPVFYSLSATPSANDILYASAGESGLPSVLTTTLYKVKAFADGKITVLYDGPEGWEDYTYEGDPYFYRDQSGDISLT